MCFIIQQGTHFQYKQKAIKPIKVYKVMYPALLFGIKPSLVGVKEWVSYFQQFLYKEGFTEWTKGSLYPIAFNLSRTYMIIEEGLHSYDTPGMAYKKIATFAHIIECTIPINSEYYYNPEDGTYVSTFLTCNKKCSWLQLTWSRFVTWITRRN